VDVGWLLLLSQRERQRPRDDAGDADETGGTRGIL
jgi:hypothetical protein